jgi:hypothetical protein
MPPGQVAWISKIGGFSYWISRKEFFKFHWLITGAWNIDSYSGLVPHCMKITGRGKGEFPSAQPIRVPDAGRRRPNGIPLPYFLEKTTSNRIIQSEISK